MGFFAERGKYPTLTLKCGTFIGRAFFREFREFSEVNEVKGRAKVLHGLDAPKNFLFRTLFWRRYYVTELESQTGGDFEAQTQFRAELKGGV